MTKKPSQNGPRPKVLICDKIADVGIEMMAEHFDVDVKTKLSPAELLNVIPGYDAMVVRSATKVRADVIDHALRLKVIGRAGSGLDNIDVARAQEKGIQVVNSPDANTVAVAELTMGLLLSLARQLPHADHSLKEGRWEKKKLMGTGLKGKTLGIVGFGRIGREVAIRAQGFGMKILVNQRRQTPESMLEQVTSVDLNDLLRAADFVTMHVPLRPETRNMISTAQLALMKPTAYLINTARGGVIDEGALLTALNEGQITGAALDVFAEEPAIDNALVQHDRVVATPHIAASTVDAQEAAAVTIAEQIIDVLEDTPAEQVLPLRVTMLDKIIPHEHVDVKRVERLAAQIKADGRISNPPVVIEMEDGRFLVLDGATRTAAMKHLQLSHAVVQVVPPDEGLGLRTWYHVIHQLAADDVVQMMEDLPDISLQEVDADKADEALFEYGGLCYVQLVDGRTYLVQAATGVNRLEALNRLTAAYIEAGEVERTLENELIMLKTMYPEMTAVVIFPEYTVNQVMQATLSSGRYFPAGITRFIIPGRILRLNADLAMLKSDKSLREKNRWLHNLLVEKQMRGEIRYYAEPVYLLDE